MGGVYDRQQRSISRRSAGSRFVAMGGRLRNFVLKTEVAALLAPVQVGLRASKPENLYAAEATERARRRDAVGRVV